MGQAVISIAPMGVDDVSEVARLEEAHQPNPWSEQIFRDEVSGLSRHYLVARTTQIVGFGGVMIVMDDAHVTNLLVDTEHRRQGLGRRLMIELIKSCVKMGARHLTLEVRSKNEAARSFYASFGMAPVGVRPGYYGDDDALILWVHDIDEPEYLGGLE